MDKERLTKKLVFPLYEEKYIQTLWNTPWKDKQEKGWILKSGIWVPWFFNMRPVGNSPELFREICGAMAEMIGKEDINLIIGVEMAGVPLVGGIAISSYVNGKEMRFGYTRALPLKARVPLDALRMLNEIDSGVANFDYGQKEFVEGRMVDGDSVAIVDDMATDLGSKIIARLIVLREAQWRGVKVACNKIFYFLNRGAGNRLKGLQFAEVQEMGLIPERLDVDYIVEFDECLPQLKKIMQPIEFEVISEFQKNPKRYQDEAERNKVLALVK